MEKNSFREDLMLIKSQPKNQNSNSDKVKEDQLTIPKTEKHQRVQLDEKTRTTRCKKTPKISFIKSAIRIIGYSFLPFSLDIATILLIFSEIIGIIEELV